jgi:nucleotide-binding universal stress UspA family protein
MFAKILVPLDGSPLAEMALKPALTFARWSDSRVYLIRIPAYRQAIIPDATGEALLWDEGLEKSAREEAQAYLQGLQAAHPEVKICLRLVAGDEAGAIVDVAEEEGIDLIIMSTHGYSGLTRWVLGSVTEKVLRAAPCPVLVVRSEEPMRNVLITIDGSELSHTALAPGLEAARRLGADVCLLRVYQAGELAKEERVQLDWVDQEKHIDLHEGARASALAYLQNLARQSELPGQEIRVAAMEGSAAHTILDYAQAQGYELIVMATHGRTGLRRWVYGSVAEKVMRGAHCNVLITRPHDDALR